MLNLLQIVFSIPPKSTRKEEGTGIIIIQGCNLCMTFYSHISTVGGGGGKEWRKRVGGKWKMKWPNKGLVGATF